MSSSLTNAEVLARGRFVQSVDHDVLRVRVLDRYTLYVDERVVPLTSDLVTSFLLAAAAGMALLAFGVAAAVTPDRRLRLFFLLAGLAATALAFDEQYELLDSFAYNVEVLYVPDLFIYVPLGIVGVLAFRRIITRSRVALGVFAAGTALFIVAQIIDRLPHDRYEGIEEKLEIVATVLLVGAFMILVAHHLVKLTATTASRG